MTKEMRKANARLAEAQAYVKQVALDNDAKRITKALIAVARAAKAERHRLADAQRKAQGQKTEEVKKPRVEYTITNATFSSFEIKKLAKGHYQVKADGMVIQKTFKSITAAEEWCAIHKK